MCIKKITHQEFMEKFERENPIIFNQVVTVFTETGASDVAGQMAEAGETAAWVTPRSARAATNEEVKR